MIVKFKEWLEAHDFKSMNPYDQVDLLAHRDEVNDKSSYLKYMKVIFSRMSEDVRELSRLCNFVGTPSQIAICNRLYILDTCVEDAVLAIRDVDNYSGVGFMRIMHCSLRSIISGTKVLNMILNSDIVNDEERGEEIKRIATEMMEGMHNLRKVSFLMKKLPSQAGVYGDVKNTAKLEMLSRKLRLAINSNREDVAYRRLSHRVVPQLNSVVERLKWGSNQGSTKKLNIPKILDVVEMDVRGSGLETAIKLILPIIQELKGLIKDPSFIAPPYEQPVRPNPYLSS